MTTPLVQAVQEPPLPAPEGNDIRSANYLPAAPDVAQVQAAFEAGQLTQEQALGLAAVAAQEAQVLPEQAEEERLGDLLRRQPVVRVYSRALGETVVWAADDAEVPADSSLVVWQESELRQMAGRTPEVKTIHAVKRTLDGEVIDSDG